MIKLVVLVCALGAVACNLDKSDPAPMDMPDAGIAPSVDAAPDATPACVAEFDFTFCGRHGATCGQLTAEDNCGDVRTAACGSCGGNQTCGSSNVCGCEPETTQELCTTATAQCGSITVVDKCGATRTVSCADTCIGPNTCGGGWAANTCGSTTCTADGWCRPTTSSINQLYDFKAVWMAAANNGWAAGENSGGFIYRWNGTTWRRVLTSNRGLYAIAGKGLTDAWIGGGYGVTYHYDGTSLTSGSAGCFSCDVFDMHALSSQDIWGIGYDHRSMHYEGSGWGVNNLYGGALLDVWGVATNDIWAVGAGGTLLHYTGATWNVVASGTTQTLRAVTGTASNRVWFGGSNGVVLYWNGSTLAPQQSGTTRAITSMWALTTTDIWAAGDDGLLLHKQ